ncbi:hypothetical protein [Acetonema longum]|uniref:Uncharacterized protein n=1 Tax=Acetonema longum DSM 6540 TaxID=1009370 RepID=F7NQ79_9FIRM|nr:hypothetical protein [Acetonema longum]EGO61838.1 hypothetical protein ALO_21399 [Acetonema longum DSM 6540]
MQGSKVIDLLLREYERITNIEQMYNNKLKQMNEADFNFPNIRHIVERLAYDKLFIEKTFAANGLNLDMLLSQAK